MTEWEPSTEAEAAMRDALRANDQERYFAILARADLLLPVSADALAGRAPMGWGTWSTGGRTHILAFTSEAALRSSLGPNAGPARTVRYHELADAWPNLEWWLAVNPGLPIEGYLPAWYVNQLARGDVGLPGRSRTPGQGPGQGSGPAGAVRARASVPVPGQILPSDEHPARRVEANDLAHEHRRPAGAGSPAFAAVTAASSAVAEPGSHLLAPRVKADPPPQPDVPDQAVAVPADTTDGRDPAGEEFHPANEVEAGLLTAVREGNTNSLFSTLLLATVLLPMASGFERGLRPGDERFSWRTEILDGERCVVVFTSPERLADHLPFPAETMDVRVAQLIRHWPDGAWSLAVNPGAPIAVRLSGSQVIALASRAAEVGLGDEPDEAVAPDTPEMPKAMPRPAPNSQDSSHPPTMQKTIPPEHVSYYLERGYDRVSGFVNRANELAHLTTPAQLINALGLAYPGSPFSNETEEIYVLRWRAYQPSLYRIPYGGQNEAAMRAMEGWVIEQSPFRGNGFAPGESGEIIAEFKVDSVRLPHGAQLWQVRPDGTERIVAIFDSDRPAWQRVGES